MKMSSAPVPKISVIIPTYNRAAMLPRAIGSVLAQTYQNWELIVVDDASTDDTKGVVRSFRDSRVRYVKLERNSGPSRARNTGMHQARGQYLAFLDSDDEWLPHKLAIQLRQFETNPYKFPRLGVVLGRRRPQCEHRASPQVSRLRPTRGDVRSVLFGAGRIRGHRNSDWPTMLARRDWLDAIGGFDEQLHASEWWDLCARLSTMGQFDDVELPVEIYWQHDGSRAWTPDRRISALQHLLTKYERNNPRRRRHQSHALLVIGVLELQRRRVDTALRQLVRSFLIWPRPKTVWFLTRAVWEKACPRRVSVSTLTGR
jgi:glycosyltransferase involved in cell wall biosynthesis